ncbi:hypothetical protein [Streptomyces sp. NRRL WC-3742]|uniref:hypothetical protein n=1 Tax=Streptomyces sp. NRRL WC-3742 TaxID=1463934 RepID=UPI0004C6BA50|nr:hypothetical protein [Streptomyces sp. NRRL WC-3742]
MDLETMPRRRRRAVALAGVALAAVMAVAGCDDGGKSASDAAASGTPSASASASASGTPSPTDSSSAAAPSAPGQPPTAVTPTPASPAPGRPSTPGTPPPNGIAPGEPNPAGTSRPAIAYRLDGTSHLTVYFYGGVCTTYSVKADESTQGRVEVMVIPGRPVTQPGQVCTALAKRQSVAVDLRSPLAGRTVIDKESGQDVPLQGDAHAGPDPVTPDGAQ